MTCLIFLLRLCMRMMLHTAPCHAGMCTLQMRVGHVEQMSEISQSSRTTTVESNMKSEHILYLACEDSTACFLLLHFFLFLSCPYSIYCTLTSLLSLSQCRQPSAAFSTQLRKIGTLWRTSCIVLPVLHCQEVPFFPVLHC